MREKRIVISGEYYHVTSRTNNKEPIFSNKMSQKIMLITLEDAKSKFNFKLANFCVMPSHIHLLIMPIADTDLSTIMHWIKLKFAKRWNCITNSLNHLWGNRYFSRVIRDPYDYDAVMNYIDQNPVEAGLAPSPTEWEASGAFFRVQKIPGIIDF